jgi:hypothetical protein
MTALSMRFETRVCSSGQKNMQEKIAEAESGRAALTLQQSRWAREQGSYRAQFLDLMPKRVPEGNINVSVHGGKTFSEFIGAGQSFRPVHPPTTSRHQIPGDILVIRCVTRAIKNDIVT